MFSIKWNRLRPQSRRLEIESRQGYRVVHSCLKKKYSPLLKQWTAYLERDFKMFETLSNWWIPIQHFTSWIDLGSMLWTLFKRFLPIFGEKIGVFLKKPYMFVLIHFSLNLAVFWDQNSYFLAKIFLKSQHIFQRIFETFILKFSTIAHHRFIFKEF
jgi:hypothetical protein